MPFPMNEHTVTLDDEKVVTVATIPRSPGWGARREDYPCRVCGRRVRVPPRFEIHEVRGGGVMVRRDSEPCNDGGAELGFQPVGPECQKLIPSEYLHETRRGA